MAITATVTKRFIQGNKKVKVGTATLGTYVADGIAVTASDFGLQRLDHLSLNDAYDPSGDKGIPLGWNAATGKITCLYDQGTASAAALDDATAESLAAYTFGFRAEGV
jgi:hypothetical protein